MTRRIDSAWWWLALAFLAPFVAPLIGSLPGAF